MLTAFWAHGVRWTSWLTSEQKCSLQAMWANSKTDLTLSVRGMPRMHKGVCGGDLPAFRSFSLTVLLLSFQRNPTVALDCLLTFQLAASQQSRTEPDSFVTPRKAPTAQPRFSGAEDFSDSRCLGGSGQGRTESLLSRQTRLDEVLASCAEGGGEVYLR